LSFLGNHERAVIFANTPLVSKVTREMNHWFFDGTFASTPPGFEQVLTVAVEMKGVVVSPIMVLMTCRAQELYDEVVARSSELGSGIMLTPGQTRPIGESETK
jgi:hypothetical protein